MCRIQLPSGFCYEPGSGEDEELLSRLGEEAEDEGPEAMRLPTCEEWDRLVDVTGGADSLMHWSKVYSWCQNTDSDWVSTHAVLGYHSAQGRFRNYYNAAHRDEVVGFRPTVEIQNPDILGPDGATVMIGTLYMDGQPVKVPQNPVWDGDIPDYIPGAKLELSAPIQNAAYQVRAIKVGNILIADRVLLKNISRKDLREQGIC